MKPNLTVYKSSAGSGKTFTLSINYIAICLSNKSKDYLYSSAMMGAGEILEGPVGSRGSCKKL